MRASASTVASPGGAATSVSARHGAKIQQQSGNAQPTWASAGARPETHNSSRYSSQVQQDSYRVQQHPQHPASSQQGCTEPAPHGHQQNRRYSQCRQPQQQRFRQERRQQKILAYAESRLPGPWTQSTAGSQANSNPSGWGVGSPRGALLRPLRQLAEGSAYAPSKERTLGFRV